MSTYLHYETSGEPGRPAVLFLHGFMGASGEWNEIVDTLRHDYFCVSIDLPGHGRSIDLPDPKAYTMEGASKMLERVLEKVEIDRVNVVGYSMGGRLALYFARYHDAICRHIVLESASPGLKSAADRAARLETDEARARRLETGDYADFLDEWYRQPMFSTLGRHEGLRERMITSRTSNSPAELARSLRGMGTGAQPAMWDALELVRTPVLAVAGALDGKFVEIAEQMAVLMPNMRTAIIANAGHNVHAEFPSVFADLLKDFFNKPHP